MKLASAFLIVGVVALAIYSIQLRSNLQKMEEALLVERSKYVDLKREVEARKPEMPAANGTDNSIAKAAVISSEKKSSSEDDSPNLFTEFSKVSDKRQMRLIYHTYGRFLKRLKLSPVETQKLANLLAARDLAQKDARDAARNAGLSDSLSQNAVAAATKDIDAELKAALGDRDYAKLQEFPVVNMLRSAVTASVGVDLEMAGVPLTDEQATQVAEIWANKQNPGKNAGLLQRSGSSALPRIYQAILEDTSTILSPKQTEIFRVYFSEQSRDVANSTLVKD